MLDSKNAKRLLSLGAASALLASAQILLADVVIPSSAFIRGAGGSEFHSDVRVFNPTQGSVTVVPVFYDAASGGTFTAPAVTLAARSQVAFDNVLASLFSRPLGSFGPIRFQTTAPIIVSSGVNNVNACQGGGSGQWLPGVDVGQATTAGTLVQLASSVDTTAGYRTNIAVMNAGAQAANVTIRVRKGDGTLLSQTATPIAIQPNGFTQINNFGSLPGVAGTDDTNLWAEFTSDAPVLAFASVINNASGDPYAILATAEPGSSSGVAPVASYSVAPPQPKVGDTVTFTDTSSNGPTAQLWAFGDGAILTSGATATRTYAAAGTYHTAHFVANAAGADGTAKDVVVSAPATPTQVTVTASQWKFTPDPLTLNVGTTYQITWQSSDVMHGVGGIPELGITQCDVVTKTAPCKVTFTPTASMVGTHPYACTQSSCGAGHTSMKGSIVIR